MSEFDKLKKQYEDEKLKKIQVRVFLAENLQQQKLLACFVLFSVLKCLGENYF